MTNKETRDARVAEIMGYTVWNWVGFHKTQSIFPPGLDPAVEYPNSEYEKIDWDNYNEDYCTNTVKPYISAPTFATDGIVLEWVQGQGKHWLGFGRYLRRMKKFYMDAHDSWVLDNEFIGFSWDDMPDSATNWFVMHSHYYKPGMYALAVKEERGVDNNS